MTDGCYGYIDSVIINRDGFNNIPNDHFLFSPIKGTNVDKTVEARKYRFLIDVEGGKLCIADFYFLLGNFRIAALDFSEKRNGRIVGLGGELQKVIALALHFCEGGMHGLCILLLIRSNEGIDLIDKIKRALHEIALRGEGYEKIEDAVFQLAILDAMDALILATVYAPIGAITAFSTVGNVHGLSTATAADEA